MIYLTPSESTYSSFCVDLRCESDDLSGAERVKASRARLLPRKRQIPDKSVVDETSPFQRGPLAKDRPKEWYRFVKTKTISPVDVDVFAHAIRDDTYSDELLDLIHKLRMSSESSNTLNSTSHAVIRYLMNFGKLEQLLAVLDDRLNYGVFLEDFSANLLLDTFLKKEDYVSAARVASQLMLQEDFKHPISSSLSLLACYKYLLSPGEWPQPSKPEEPEEEVRIRVNYVRNPYNDEHFDLVDPIKIVGKTLMYITKNSVQDILYRSFHLLGVSLFKPEQSKSLVEKLRVNKEKVYEDVVKLLPEDNVVKHELHDIQASGQNIIESLESIVKTTIDTNSERDIAQQCETYTKWDKERKEALQKQKLRLETMQRLANIKQSQEKLKDKEMLLWFFENEEKIELEIEAKKVRENESMQTTKTLNKDMDENYVPPEVHKQRVT
ncbi:hypothetical protein FQR65_LT13093 [Abscondita terminalis]|nr:hypothetical protein FQR65_LT13093 [Abscondita terminalis]